MYWRLGPAYRGHGERNRLALRELVESGSPCGLLAFHGDVAVGWCQLTPRAALPYLERAPLLKRVDDLPVWHFKIAIGSWSAGRGGPTVWKA